MKDNSNKGFWNRVAKIYSPDKGDWLSLYSEICSDMKPYINKECSVLELAAGTGQITKRVYDMAGHYTATDFSPKMLAEAEKKLGGRGIEFSVCDATDMPYEDNSFDCVIIANALHIMPNPEKALKEIKRVLKPEGYLFAPTFIKSDKGYVSFFIMRLGGFKTFFQWNDRELAEVIEKAGFEVVFNKVIETKIRDCCSIGARVKK